METKQSSPELLEQEKLEKQKFYEELFNNYTTTEQWEWILNHKEEVTLLLDPTDTTLIIGEENSPTSIKLDIHADIGNRFGVEILLGIIGISAKQA